MQLNQFRDRAASLMRTTPDAMLNRQKKVQALMQEEAPTENIFGTGRPIQATPLNAAILVITTLDAAPIEQITERTMALWRAAYAQKAGPVCPVTGASTAGEALVALIEEPLLRKRLDCLELAREISTISLAWRGKGFRPSVFHIYPTPQDWKRAESEARETGTIHTATIAGPVFEKIAALIEKHQ